MSDDRVDDRWALYRAGGEMPSGPPSAPLSDVWDESFDDLEERERDLYIREGQPVLLRPDGSVDGDVLAYFNDYSFQGLALQTQLAYATDLKVYFSFLWGRGMDWSAVTPSMLSKYALWRLMDPQNPRTVHDTRFARELAAIRRFHEWAVREGKMASSPVVLRAFRLPDGTIGTTAALRPPAVRSSRVKWLMPNAYARWRREGLEGYGTDGLGARSWRGRNEARNVAFCEALWWSGLRLREAATLLSWEVPREIPEENWAVGTVGRAVAKGPGRSFLMSRRALRAIRKYRRTNRAAAVRRARAEGRYDDLRGIMVVSYGASGRHVVMTGLDGEKYRMSLDTLGAEDRRRIFVSTPQGIEPAMLWLKESGMPMPYETWQPVFRRANERSKSRGAGIYCTPHMLRHSFALRALVNFMARKNLQWSPYAYVQGLLGHRSVETTKEIYLEPAKNMDAKEILEIIDGSGDGSGFDESATEILHRIADATGLVQDVPQ